MELATSVVALCAVVLFLCLLLFMTSKLHIVMRKMERIEEILGKAQSLRAQEEQEPSEA